MLLQGRNEHFCVEVRQDCRELSAVNHTGVIYGTASYANLTIAVGEHCHFKASLHSGVNLIQLVPYLLDKTVYSVLDVTCHLGITQLLDELKTLAYSAVHALQHVVDRCHAAIDLAVQAVIEVLKVFLLDGYVDSLHLFVGDRNGVSNGNCIIDFYLVGIVENT